MLLEMNRSVKMEKERGFGGGAPRALFLATQFRLLENFGNEISVSSSIVSLMEKKILTLYVQVEHTVYILKLFAVILNLRRQLQENASHHEG